MNNSKYICIHGHFYQPPRENAWLEAIEKQPSAGAPYHNWNERIHAECYRPNAFARVLDSQKLIRKLVNNYEHISFNFGATLLSWMEKYDAKTYQAILSADKKSAEKRNGHGNALAQVYNHIIQPLANARDNETQIIWGLRDFENRFCRKAEGIWLAETAVDTKTLELLVNQGITFTVLSPNQVKAVRPIGEEDWQQKDYHSIDTRRAYRCDLPSGKSIDLFFYDGNTAKDVAFNKLLNSGQVLADRLLQPFDGDDQLVHIATDGESYGHHHNFGEMALAYCVEYLETNGLAQLTNYGEYLELHPPSWNAQIHDNSSWSCAHGVERWRSDCGCHTGGRAGWHQQWREPLRLGLNWLRDALAEIFESQSDSLLKDSWAARNDYVNLLNESENRTDFFKKHQKKKLSKKEQTQVLQLLEMQKLSMYMYTSCGWFFNDISGIETIQILQYADKAIHYASYFSKKKLESGFLQILDKGWSNLGMTGKEIFEKSVVPKRMTDELLTWNLLLATVNLAENEGVLFSHNYDFEKKNSISIGETIAWAGTLKMTTQQTNREKEFDFFLLKNEQHELQGIIGKFRFRKTPEAILKKIAKELEGSDDLDKTIGGFIKGEFFERSQSIPEFAAQFYGLLSENVFAETRQKIKTSIELRNKSNQPLNVSNKRVMELIHNEQLDAVFFAKSLDVSALKQALRPFIETEVSFFEEEKIARKLDLAVAEYVAINNSNPKLLERLDLILVLVQSANLKANWYHTQNAVIQLIETFPERGEAIRPILENIGISQDYIELVTHNLSTKTLQNEL